MSRLVKFYEKSKIDNPIYWKATTTFARVIPTILMRFWYLGLRGICLGGYITNMLRDGSKTENYCKSGPVKFDKKSQIVKPAGNHTSYFPERSTSCSTGSDIRQVDWELCLWIALMAKNCNLLQVLSNVPKNRTWQTFWKPSIFLPRVVVDLVVDNSLALL